MPASIYHNAKSVLKPRRESLLTMQEVGAQMSSSVGFAEAGAANETDMAAAIAGAVLSPD
jgi:hypothetical protein